MLLSRLLAQDTFVQIISLANPSLDTTHHPLTHIRGDNIDGKLRPQYTSTIAYFNIHTDSIVLLEF